MQLARYMYKSAIMNLVYVPCDDNFNVFCKWYRD